MDWIGVVILRIILGFGAETAGWGVEPPYEKGKKGVGEQLGAKGLRALIWINDNQVNTPGKKSGSCDRIICLENKFGNLQTMDDI